MTDKKRIAELEKEIERLKALLQRAKQTKEITVTFKQEFADDVSIAEIYKWARFKLGATGSLEKDNPLEDTDLDALCFSVLVME